MTASCRVERSTMSTSQTRNAVNYAAALWENMIELLENYVKELKDTDISNDSARREISQKLLLIMDMIPMDDFWERPMVVNAMDNWPASELGIALIGLQRTCMGLRTINLMESAMERSPPSLICFRDFQRSVCSLYTKAWFDDILRNAPFIEWENNNEELYSESDIDTDDDIANAETEIESGNETDEESDEESDEEGEEKSEDYVACDCCGIVDIDPANVTESVAINLAERGGGYIHEHCQESEDSDSEESDFDNSVQMFNDVVRDLLEDELLFGNEAEIAIRDYENNFSYTTRAWTAYVFHHNNLNLLASELSENIDEQRIISANSLEITV
jgi:hypothetical protein